MFDYLTRWNGIGMEWNGIGIEWNWNGIGLDWNGMEWQVTNPNISYFNQMLYTAHCCLDSIAITFGCCLFSS